MSFSMCLDVGVEADDIFAAERMLGRAMNISFRLRNDLELGGAFFIYEREGLQAGIASVRIRTNERGTGSFVLPRMKELAYIAEIVVVGKDLLELGRVAAALSRAPDSAIRVCGYNMVVLRPWNAPGPLWRAHSVEIGPGAASAPTLTCHSTFALATSDMNEAVSLVQSIFGRNLQRGHDDWLGGDYYSFAPGPEHELELPSLMVRKNAINVGLWLYPCWKDAHLVLDVGLRTPNLVTFGMLVYDLETRAGSNAQIIGWRVAGDLVRDRIPRMLTREFETRDDAASTWRHGHAREVENDEGDTTEDTDDEDEDEALP